MGLVVFGSGVSRELKKRQRPFPILDDHVEPVEGIVDGSIRSESGQSESPGNADTPCVLVDLPMTFADVSWCPLWFRASLLAESQPKRGFCWRVY